jgi:GTPase SAR1 family protein
MTDWVKELRQMRGADLPIIIVGNKSDLESSRVVSKESAETYSRKIGVDHYLASAKTGHNVEDVFRTLTESKFSFFLSKIMCIGIVANKANNASAKKKVNTRGMLNVKGLYIDQDDDESHGIELSASLYRKTDKKKKDGGCKC